MSVIATALKHLIAAGISGDDLVRAVAEMEAELASMPAPVDRAAEKRRAWDRERKRVEADARRSGGIPVESAESAETGSLSRPPNEINSNPPTHTLPECESPRARKADPFPKPDWAEPQHWDDLKSNRKTKRLANTPTAYAKLLRDIDRWTNDAWPPGRVLEAVVARGWAAAEHDPRGNSHGRPHQNTERGLRGSRPDPALDMLIQAERELQAEAERESQVIDFAARAALPAR